MKRAIHDVVFKRYQPFGLLSRLPRASRGPVRTCTRWAWLCLAIILPALLLHAADTAPATNSVLLYSVRTWQTDEGLPHNTVKALAQSSDGYLWVGTRQGLARFDGLRFQSVDEPGMPELKQGSISSLCAGRDGSLWIGCEGKGVIRLKAGKFSRLTEAEGLPSNQVNCLLEDREGALWIGTEGGLTRYRSGNITTFTDRQSLGDNSVRGLCEDHEGVLRIATRRGLSSFSHDRIISTVTFGTNWTGNALRCVSEDRQGNLWTGSNDGLYCQEGGSRHLYGIGEGLPAETINAAYEDHAGQLWVGTYKGLVRIVDGKFVPRPPGEAVFWDKANVIFEDREQNLWVGGEDGLYRLNPARFTSLTTQQGLSDNNVMSVCEDRQHAIWIATWGGGLNRLQDGQITTYTTTNGLTAGKDKVLALCEAGDGSLWMGFEAPGNLNRFQGEYRNNFPQNNSLLKEAVRVIYEDRQGGLWIGSNLGLNKWLGAGRFATYTHLNGLCAGPVMAICQDAKSNLWVGTETGLSCWNGKEFKNFTVHEGLSHNMVNALYVDSEGTLWIGTRGGGLNRYKDGVFKAFTTREGLFSDVVYEIVEDDFGYFWMTCRNGLFRVKRKQLEDAAGGSNRPLTCTSFGKADGLLTDQFNGVAKPAGWKSHDGRLWFSTIRGVLAVDSRIETNDRLPPVAVERVLADSRVVADFKLGVLGQAAGQLEIAPGRGDLEIYYAALSLQAPEKNRFKYKLEPFDSDWAEATTERQVHYSHLAPGRYQFRVQACNNDGVWNEPGATLALVLQPHFWQTVWFKAMIVAVFGLLLTVAYRVRMARLQAIERLRVQIAANLHDDVGARLTKMAMVTEFADRETAATDPSKPHLQTLSKTTREIIQAMDEIVWTINPKNDNLDDLANYIFQYAQEYFQQTQVSCRLDFPAQLPHWPISTEARHNLFMAVKEAFNNVLKHAEASEVRVSLTAADGKMTITIADNGLGFDTATVRFGGNGLENMRQRLSRIGGRLVLESQPGQGTRIRMEAKGG